MRRRVGLAQTLIGQPRLLVLDEPTSGLDPVSRRDFYDLLDGLAADGAAILLSSHVLTEVEARTDNILILSKGSLVAEGTLTDLRARAQMPVCLVIRPAPGRLQAVQSAFPHAVAGADGLLRLSCHQAEKLSNIRRTAALGADVANLDVLPPSLSPEVERRVLDRLLSLIVRLNRTDFCRPQYGHWAEQIQKFHAGTIVRKTPVELRQLSLLVNEAVETESLPGVCRDQNGRLHRL